MDKSENCIIYKQFQTIIFALLLLFSSNLSAQTGEFNLIKSESWIIFDAKTNGFKTEWIEKSKHYNRVGFILHLKFDQTKHCFYHESNDGAIIKLSNITKLLLKNIKRNKNKYTLIFDIDLEYLTEFNREIKSIVKLMPETVAINNSDNISNILNSKNLLFFCLNKHSGFIKDVLYFYNYFEDHHIEESNEKQIKTPTKAQASILYDLFKQGTISTQNLDFKSITDERHYWQNKYINHWTSTGLQPLFIVTDGLVENINEFIEIANTTNYTETCNGLIHIHGVPLDYVYWEGEELLYSYGYFNQPMFSTRILKPYRPGYSFTPKQIKIEQGQSSEKIRFTAKPISLSQNIELDLSFNQKNILKSSNLHNPKIKNCETVTDKERGKVLRINPKGYLSIGDTEDFNLKDNSFTLSCWFKTADTIQGSYEIFGTNTTIFREGLHLEVRGRSPYFGFFINDVQSSSCIAYKTWHHLAYSYDKICQEKRIYIDGKLTDVALNSPSFISSDSLYIGKCINLESKLPFYLDNFTIWSRTLNENEIQNLQTEDNLLITKQQASKHKQLIVIVSLLALTLLIYFLVTFKFKKENYTKRKVYSKSENKKNAIYLFGNLVVLDKNRMNIIPSMSPLLKELFLKLLSANIMGLDGETSQNLTKLFWGNLSTQKARNTRNVALARLRKHINDVEGLSIAYTDGKHRIILSDELYIDYIETTKIESLTNNQDIQLYFDMVKRGKFLSNVAYEWLEEKQDKINQEIITILLGALENESVTTDNKLIENICMYILYLDDLNEDALFHLLKHYNKHSKAIAMKKAYSDYTNTYRKVYGVPCKYAIEEFLENM